MGHKSPTDMNVKGRNDGSSFSFTTASGRPIKVSEAAVSKAKLLFTEELKEIQDHEGTLETQSRNNESGAQIPAVGYGATKDRHVTVTNKLSLKDNNLFSEKTAQTSKNVISSVGFTMANSRPNNISRRSLPMTQQEFINDQRKETNNSSMNIINNEFQTVGGKYLPLKNIALLEKEVIPLAGFKTAGGSLINISSAALSKAKQRFEDDIQKETNESSMDIIDNEFQTISSQHLAVTRPVLPKVEVSFSERTTEYKKSPMPLAGFKTAGGSSINVSSTALSKAKQRFQDDMKKESNESNMNIILPEVLLSEGRVENTKNVMSSIGFTTAGGNSINVSERALSQARQLFANDFEDADKQLAVKNEVLPEALLSEGRVENTKNVMSSIGFTTAGGNSINVSEMALSQAKQLFANDFEDADKQLAVKNEVLPEVLLSEGRVKNTKNVMSSIGFTTAGGNSINVSERALSQAKQLFANDFEDLNKQIAVKNEVLPEVLLSEGRVKNTKNVMSSIGFTTAGGNSINVSERALSQAKQLFANDFEDADKQLAVKNEVLPEVLLSEGRVKNTKNVMSSIGFTTAGGNSINVSERALSQAKQLFANDFEDADKQLAVKNEVLPEVLLSEGRVKNTKNVMSSIGFTTAGGNSINVSERALSQAKQLFANDFEDLNKQIAVKNEVLPEVLLSEGRVKNTKNVMSSIGFTTAGGNSINVSERALSQAKQLFANDFEDADKQLAVKNEVLPEVLLSEGRVKNTKNVMSSIGFTTAGGNSINVSERALSQAKQLFANDFEDADKQLAVKNEVLPEVLLSEGRVENTKNVMSSIGFTTAGGNSINVSERALSQAKQLFANDFEDADKQLAVKNEVLPEVLLSEGRVENTKNVMSSIGFTTASGNSVNVSEMALSQAKQLFANDFENADKFNEMDITVRQINKPEMQVQNIVLQAASGQGVLKETLLKAKSLVSEVSENFKSSPALTKSVQKRKIKDLDDDVPLKKQVKSNHFKKLRFSNGFEIQRNTGKDLKNNERNENQTVSSTTTEVSIANNTVDKSFDNIYRTKRSRQNNDIDNSLISNEIVASTVALLADENNSGIVDQWLSPVQTQETNDVANVPSSPVIGGHFIPRKQRSLGGRKKSINALQTTEDKSVRKHDLKGLNVNYESSDQSTGKKHKSLAEEPERMETEKKYDTLVTNEFGDTQLLMDFINESANILEKRLEAALEQDKQISLKKKSKPNPTISKLYFHRKSNRNNRISWKEISKGNVPVPCTYKELIQRKLPPEILDVTANNAITYKFRCADFYGQDIVQNNIEGIKLEDGGCLILDENNYVGISEIKRSFLASPGVDPDLIPAGWVKNHYKWIVWKLASLDRIKFGSEILSRALTPDRVMTELKYRYDREIDRSERPALRKILEKDDVASKRMVLCVSSIMECDDSATTSKSPNQLKMPSKRLILTDGWYSVQASIDQAMIKNIISGKLKEGMKLMTYGSELLNCDQGCSPLEIPENVCLRIHTNSTRRARWDTKLGYVVPLGPMCIKLRDICSTGGLIGKIKVLVARVYPVLYHEKTLAGESIFRNARCEERCDTAYKKERQSKIEAFYAESEGYFSEDGRKNNTPDSIDLAAMEWNEDREKLSNKKFHSKQEQQQLINKCRLEGEQLRQKLESRLQASLPTPRQVTPLLKVRVIEENTSAILSHWSPSEEITDVFKEGNYISICNLTPSCRRGSELQLTAGRSAVFNQINNSNIIYPSRSFTPLFDVNKPTFTPPYGEFDTVGIVVSIANEPYGMKNFQAAYLAYPNTNSQSSYLSVLFWQGISSYGYAEILTVGSSVACSNLEWRRATSWNIQMSYCTERSVFTRNPRQNHLRQPFNDLKRLITDTAAYLAMCGVEISEEAQKKSTTRMSDQYTPNKIPFNDSFHSDKQIGNCAVQELLERSSTTARSVAIQKRLEKLHYYGEPSGLSPIVLNNSSNRVSLDFQSPVRKADAKQSNVHVSLNTKFSQNLT